MTRDGVISGVSVAQPEARVDEIEAASETDPASALDDLLVREAVSEAFVIQTCNRAEAYVVTDVAADGRRAVAGYVEDVREGAIEHLDHEESIRHLMRVAAGLESLVLGEDQILGQVKDAADLARERGALEAVLDEALLKAVHVGERARDETGINEGVVSVGSAAVELAATDLELAGATAVVVGAGEMGTLAARALDEAGVGRLLVANRTLARAEHVANEVGADAEAVPLTAIETVAADAPLVIAATGSEEYVVDDDDLAAVGETLCIDLGQPRDIDPAAAAHAHLDLRDIDDLEAVTAATRERRQAEAREVEAMIDREFERLLAAFKRKRADEAVSAMYEAAERVKAREVREAVAKLDEQGELTPDQRETVEAMADALVGQLLAAPTKSLKDAAEEDDWNTIRTAMELFDPGFGVERAEGEADEAADEVVDD